MVSNEKTSAYRVHLSNVDNLLDKLRDEHPDALLKVLEERVKSLEKRVNERDINSK